MVVSFDKALLSLTDLQSYSKQNNSGIWFCRIRQSQAVRHSNRPKETQQSLIFLRLPRLQVTVTEIKCMEGYGNTLLFFPLCFWRAETAPKAPRLRELRQERCCSPLRSYSSKKRYGKSCQGDARGAHTCWRHFPVEMLIAKQGWEASTRSLCYKTTKKLLGDDMISGVFLPEKLLSDSRCEQAWFCRQRAELCSSQARQLGWQTEMAGSDLHAVMAFKDKIVAWISKEESWACWVCSFTDTNTLCPSFQPLPFHSSVIPLLIKSQAEQQSWQSIFLSFVHFYAGGKTGKPLAPGSFLTFSLNTMF